ncbi:MAG: HAD family phosphatase [Gammaproteobacteria bacterium]|nr:HAD family phosphatase [Gammaproteobacteria bacterium]
MKALLLDLGGVVIDVDPQRCFAYWAEAAGVGVGHVAERWCADEAYEAFEIGAIGFGEYLESLSARLDISLGEDDWRAGWNALLGDPIADVVAALPALASRVPLYCFSNTNVVHQATWEQRHADALAPFRRIYVSWQLGMRKPCVAAFQRVVDDIGVAPEDIVFLDDNAANVRGARAAGLVARHVPDAAATMAALREKE